MIISDDPALARRARSVLRRLPRLCGSSIRLQSSSGLLDSHGPVHGGSFLRERRIALDCSRAEFPRILVHELFHFVWLRLGNGRRREYEEILRADRCTGELGWSAQWRKKELTKEDARNRTRRWREYCCESFCDTAAWLYSGIDCHPEFSLCRKSRDGRRDWFRRALEIGSLSI
jgi:hypothetical protein